MSNCPLIFLFMFLVLGCTSPKGFEFMAIGDVPYHLPEDFERYENLIEEINEQQPAFSLHVGDIKSGSTPCSDEYFHKIQDYFGDFTQPLIYTPGDNEWTDCNREACGNYDPEERLDKIRQIFFTQPQSQGKNPRALYTQNQKEGFEKFVENAYWEEGEVSFGTLHAVGSNNNLKLDSAAINDEFYEREMANLFWLNYIFDEAEKKELLGVVLVLHAALNYHDDSDKNGHKSLVNLIQERTIWYKKPVLLLYGDQHRFMVDKPLGNNKGKVLTNFTAVQVFGDRDMHAVKVMVNPRDPELFTIRQHIIDEN